MSGGKGDGEAPEALDLLAKILPKDDYILVLRYCQDHKLETDSEVLFLVALLKVFAGLHGEILRAIATAQEGCKDMEAAAILAEQNIRETVAEELRHLQKAFAAFDQTMAMHISHFELLAAEITGLKGEMQDTMNDAHAAFSAYQRLKDETSGFTLSQIFYDQARSALQQQVPIMGRSLATITTELVQDETRKLTMFFAGLLLLQVITLIVMLSLSAK